MPRTGDKIALIVSFIDISWPKYTLAMKRVRSEYSVVQNAIYKSLLSLTSCESIRKYADIIINNSTFAFQKLS